MTYFKEITGVQFNAPLLKPYDGPLRDLLGCYVRLGRGEDEIMWVKVERIEDETVFARIDNEPVVIDGMGVGDTVQFGRMEIEEILLVH